LAPYIFLQTACFLSNLKIVFRQTRQVRQISFSQTQLAGSVVVRLPLEGDSACAGSRLAVLVAALIAQACLVPDGPASELPATALVWELLPAADSLEIRRQ